MDQNSYQGSFSKLIGVGEAVGQVEELDYQLDIESVNRSQKDSNAFFDNFEGPGRFDGGFVMVKTDKLFYYPGEKVNGKIYIRADKNLDAYLLRVRVKGKETSRFRYLIDGEYVDKSNSYHYFDKKLNAFHFKGQLNPGDYTLPFEFQLPSYLPASILWEKGNEYAKPSIKIKYSIKAILILKDQEVKCKHHMVIHEPPVQFQQNQSLAQQAKLSTFCICVKVKTGQCPCSLSAGLTQISANFDKNIFYPQEIATTMVKVDNSKCSLLIKAIDFQLVQKITIKTNDLKKFEGQYVILENKDCTGVLPFNPEVTKIIQLNLGNLKHHVEAKKEKKRTGQLSSIIVPRSKEEMFQLTHLAPACHSKFCKNEYFLQAVVKYHANIDCDGSHPTFSVPMTIVPHVDHKQLKVQMPKDFQPTELDYLKINNELAVQNNF